MSEGIHTQITDIALNRYLGSEKDWCTGAFARAENGMSVWVSDETAVSHCAEGAIRAAAFALRSGAHHEVMCGVERVLAEQHPGFLEEMRKHGFASGKGLRAFNDGVATTPGVGYQGIRAAFEKYLIECQEKNL